MAAPLLPPGPSVADAEVIGLDFEETKGKVRPILPRPTDIVPSEPRTERERREGRKANGTAGKENQLALGRGWKSKIRETVERSSEVAGVDPATATDMQRISDVAAVLYRGIVGDAPVSGPLMRMNAAGCAQEFAIAAYFDAKALEAGLSSELGVMLVTRASFHRQRAERLSVTAHVLGQRRGGAKKGNSWAEATRKTIQGGKDAK